MFEHFAPFLLFVIAMTGTPGPGNLTMLAIGQATGFRSGLPFLAGMVLGTTVLDTSVALGLGRAVTGSPALARVLQLGGLAYICWLGWKVLRLRPAEREAPKRFTVWEGLVLHPLSPKSWAMAVVAFSQFVDPASPMPQQVAVFVGTFAFFALFFHSLWGIAGAALLRLLRAPGLRLAVNGSAAALMVGATAWALFGGGV
ncbi:MAG: LysE family translocator [Desulfovibrionaceae bacterium]|jgi:threonine/homoserine/homoserine lactone efflux protein|nr:LysE family translocator [Desulfovibrionaceae bacterium]